MGGCYGSSRKGGHKCKRQDDMWIVKKLKKSVAPEFNKKLKELP